MPDNMSSNQGQRHPNVRSADTAVVRAVEHQAALERQRSEPARLTRNQPAPQRMPRPENVRRPMYQQRPTGAMQRPVQQPASQRSQMPQRQGQPMQRPVQQMQRTAQPMPMQRSAQPAQMTRQGQPVNTRQPMPQRQGQPMVQRQQMPQYPAQQVQRAAQPMPRPVQAQPMQRTAQPAQMTRQAQTQPVQRPSQIQPPVPQRLQVPQQTRPVSTAMPVLHTSTQQLNTRMPVPHRPAQIANANNTPVIRSVPETISAPRHLAPRKTEPKEDESLVTAVQYEDEDEDGIEVVDSEYEEFDDEEEEVEQKRGRRERKNRYLPYLLILFFEIIIAAAAVWAITVFNEDTDLIVTEHTIEAGETANLQMYVTGNPKFPEYVSCNLDFTTVNYVLPQTVRFNVRMYGVNFPCTLNIVDTTPPTAEAIPHSMFSVDEIPPVEECVKNIKDLNETTVKWAEVPDISGGGNIIAKAVVTDSSGNETIVEVPFQVTKDSEAPVIAGTKNIEAFVGDTIRYRTDVTVTDDIDKNPQLEIDTSQVDLSKAGTYKVIYRATDFTGNTSEVEITLKLTKKPKNYVEPEKVYAEANKVLKKIIKSNMSDMEKALQITWWVRYNVNYVAKADNSSWTRAAYDGLVKRNGNCYNFAMTAKALFDAAGIENMIITRDPYIYHGHYWNYIKIDGEWYHCDSTPRLKYNSYFFMYTTKELKNFWHNGWNGYNFKENKYPKSATKSVQSKINYAGHKIKK